MRGASYLADTELCPTVATRYPMPAVHYAKINFTTSSNDPRLIVLMVHVDGASHPLLTLLGSVATNNFVRADGMSILLPRMRVRNYPREIIVKYEARRARTYNDRWRFPTDFISHPGLIRSQ